MVWLKQENLPFTSILQMRAKSTLSLFDVNSVNFDPNQDGINVCVLEVWQHQRHFQWMGKRKCKLRDHLINIWKSGAVAHWCDDVKTFSSCINQGRCNLSVKISLFQSRIFFSAASLLSIGLFININFYQISVKGRHHICVAKDTPFLRYFRSFVGWIGTAGWIGMHTTKVLQISIFPSYVTIIWTVMN